ncbi:MAG TPA: hypothetical protein DCY26_12260 [Hyphomonas sp.]|nr:hypothetical protein [Hyphomonas sp.]
MRGCLPVSDSEISRLLDLLSSPAWRRERVLIVLGLRTGLRLTSMLSLRLGDVAIAGEVQNRIRIRRGTTKGRRAGYDMPLHLQAAIALQEYLDTLLDQTPSAYLFPGRRPETRLSKTAGWRAIKRIFAAAGIAGAPTEIGTHSLRKTFAQRIYTALGHDLVRTSYAMRHASVSTTIEYLSFREEEVDAAILQA